MRVCLCRQIDLIAPVICVLQGITSIKRIKVPPIAWILTLVKNTSASVKTFTCYNSFLQSCTKRHSHIVVCSAMFNMLLHWLLRFDLKPKVNLFDFLWMICCGFVAGFCTVCCITNPQQIELECGPMPKVMATLPNIGGAVCWTSQRWADAHYSTAVQ